jgi:hypothetical protein
MLAAVVFVACALAGAATAQVTQPPLPGTTTVPPPLPPAPLSGTPPPGAPPRLDTFQDRAVRCQHHGLAHGVSPGQIGQYTRDCVHSR